MKHSLLALGAAVLLLFSLTACGSKNPGSSTDGGSGSALEDSITDGEHRNDAAGGAAGSKGMHTPTVSKADCSSVYAEVISVNGGNLTVRAGDKVLSLTAESDLLQNWSEGDEVILYYTGDFGERMQVRYIDKWTENSDVQRPDSQGKDKARDGAKDTQSKAEHGVTD